MKMNIKKQILIFFVLLFTNLSFSQESQNVFTPENANEARLNRLQPPEKVMDAIGIKPGMTVAEIGAGHGRWVVQLAVRVGKTGKIYAEDIDTKALKHLERRCKHWELKNVETILGDVTNPKLPKNKLDVIFIISTYHHFDDPVELLKNARSSLKPDGILAIGEWLKSTSPEKVKTQVIAAGYKHVRTETFLKKNDLFIYIFENDQKD
jgi:ubiquinone/menaquinone biosynthesis C-methylase UbiE